MATKTRSARKIRNWLGEAIKILVFIMVLTTGLDYWRGKDIATDIPPQMEGKTTTGEFIDVTALSQQQPVVLYFWATWCPICKFVSPGVNWLSEDVTTVSVASTSGDDRALNAYRRHHDFQFPVINDQAGHLTQQWGINVFPTVVILYQGEIKSLTTGFTTPMGIWIKTQLAYL